MTISNNLLDKDIHTHHSNIEKDGYSVVKRYVNISNTKKLNDISNEIFVTKKRSQNSAPPVGRQKVIANDPIVNNAIYYSDELLELATSGDHLKIYQHFLNDPYYGLIDQTKPNFILAQCNLRKGASALDYHVDVRMNFESPKVWSMQGILALDHRNRNNGGLKVIPGSHIRSDFPSQDVNKADEIYLDLEPGDLVVFHSTLYHATTAVKHGYDPTWGLLLTYRCWWCKPQFDFVRMISDDVKSKLTNAQKTLIGVHSLPSEDPSTAPSSRSGYS
jgi:hypothetical protein